ncbi:MAG: flotillin-like FloA family protein [Phycisphaerales bacterium]|nr:flotillin-like FloA family protein [Phycisphaerales bacterium]
MDNPTLIVAVIVFAMVLAVLWIQAGATVLVWTRARRNDAPIKMSELIGMRLRKVDIRAVAESYAQARAAGLDVTTPQLETIELTGCSSGLVISAMVEAKRAGRPLSFEDAASDALIVQSPKFAAPPAGDSADRRRSQIPGESLNLWIQARLSGVRISPLAFARMRRHRVNTRTVVLSAVRAHKAGLGLSMEAMEEHDRAGGDVAKVVSALITAKRAEINLDWRRAAAYDLSGRDIVEAVLERVNRMEESEPGLHPAGETTA